MSNNIRPTLNDYDLSDVIDLNTVLTNDNSKISQLNNTNSKKRNSYDISLESITDEELQRITRSLITPIPFQQYIESKKNNSTLSLTENHTTQIPAIRSESAAIFNGLNNDDDLSVDFAYSDLRDFIDPVLLEGVLSRPVSRAPLQLQRNTQTPIVTKSQIDLKCQLNGTQTISKKYPPETMEIRPADDINALAARYDKINIVDKNQEANIYDSERRNSIKNHKNDQRYIGKLGNDQIYDNNKPSVEPLFRKKHQINNNNTKRHSLDALTLTALRRDSDLLLQHRQSLLKLNHISTIDDTTIKKQSNKTIVSSHDKLTPEGPVHDFSLSNTSFNSNKDLSPRLVANNKRKGKRITTFQSNLPQPEQSVYYDPMFLESSNNYNNKINKHLLVETSNQHSDIQKNCIIKRYRSVSFPDQTKNKQIYRKTRDGSDYNTDIPITVTSTSTSSKRLQSDQIKMQALTTGKWPIIDRYQKMPKFEGIDLFSQSIKSSTAPHSERAQGSAKGFDKNTDMLSPSSSLSPHRLSLKRNKYSLDNRVISQYDTLQDFSQPSSHSKNIQNNKHFKVKNDYDNKSSSATESAKNVLANIRQRRVSEHQRRILRDDPKKISMQYKEIMHNKISYQAPNYFESRNEYNKLGNAKSPTSPPDAFNTPNETSVFDNGKIHKSYSSTNQSKKRHSYVTKKSTLNRSTDRYISLIGKPPSAKIE